MTIRTYRMISLVMAVAFGLTGVMIMLFHGHVLGIFNTLSGLVNIPPGDTGGNPFALALATAYMYVVTLLAVQMRSYPQERLYPLLLIHAKLASAALSLVLCILGPPLLILLVNALVDGMIGALGIVMVLRVGRAAS
jgi:hypothetical protein